MNRERMQALMNTRPGIGAICTTATGKELCYFYEDFEGPASGIRRAMAQLYPAHDKGIIKTICFMEHHPLIKQPEAQYGN